MDAYQQYNDKFSYTRASPPPPSSFSQFFFHFVCLSVHLSFVKSQQFDTIVFNIMAVSLFHQYENSFVSLRRLIRSASNEFKFMKDEGRKRVISQHFCCCFIPNVVIQSICVSVNINFVTIYIFLLLFLFFALYLFSTKK